MKHWLNEGLKLIQRLVRRRANHHSANLNDLHFRKGKRAVVATGCFEVNNEKAFHHQQLAKRSFATPPQTKRASQNGKQLYQGIDRLPKTEVEPIDHMQTKTT